MLRIKELRKEKKITQSELAQLLSTTSANISGWETDKWQPDINNLIKMCDIFDCSIDYLVGRESESGIILSPNGLTEDENYFIKILRTLKSNDKNTILELAKILNKNSN
ncbi:MAG: helix-turn-helix transcriptional regulator [Clostridia bacterium]|nr:helix-turn-helix transcriptional regulator [Clostridia bacterium]